MLNETQAKTLVKIANPGCKVVDCARYQELYLVRIEHDSPDEENYDPFFSVDINTGEVNEFSIIASDDPVGVAKAFGKST